jgi:glycosyltransferase involved in cell wall biosynthesis
MGGMKVLYFHQHFSTPEGATGTRSYQMAKALVARGHEVMMVCGSYQGSVTGLADSFVAGKRQGSVDGIHVVEFQIPYSNADGFLKRTKLFLTFALRSVKLALTEKYDLLFATTTPLTAGIPGIFARWLRGKRFVFEVRDLWPELPRAMGVIKNPLVLWAMSCLEWLSYRSAHALVGLAPGIVDGIAKRGVSRDRITFIPNGCDLSLFQETEGAWRPQGVSDAHLMAVFSGTHGVANGLDAALNAAVVLKKRGKNNVKLVLIGSGKMKPQLIERARAEGLDNVIFCDAVGKRKLAGLMAATDVGLQLLANVPAFYFGTSPNKFFDYIAAERPVLVNYPGWIANEVVDAHCGFAVPPENAEAFADALERAEGNRLELRNMGKRALDLAKAKFDRNVLAEKFVAFLEQAAT